MYHAPMLIFQIQRRCPRLLPSPPPGVVSWIVAFVLLSGIEAIGNDADVLKSIETDYRTTARPLLKRYCYDCHANGVTEADIDLAAFDTIADLRKQTKTWLKIRNVLDDGLMPPKEAAQPTERERKTLRQWVHGFLMHEAEAHAGDPGPVVLRRLSNAEYTYTIRDLTGIGTLDPVREFPVDGAAGEGFTNTGSGQGMSPALIQKYLDAAKAVAKHAVLLPEGIRFSPHTTARDRTDELLAKIQAFYRRFTEDGGGTRVNLDGRPFTTNQGGRLPLTDYLTATLAEREAIQNGTTSLEAVARERRLSAKYFHTLWNILTAADAHPSFLLDEIRRRWQAANVSDTRELTAEISQWQDVLWKFNSIGHIGRQGGPKAWMEPVTPITTKQELRYRIPEAAAGEDLVLYLTTGRIGDRNDGSSVKLQRPRIEFAAGKNRPAIELHRVRSLVPQIETTIRTENARTGAYLAAVAELRDSSRSVDDMAAAKGLKPALLTKWAELSGVVEPTLREITGHFTERMKQVQGNSAVNGWGSGQTPSLLTNASDEPASFLTLTIPARGVTVHPSPKLESVVAWRSPVDATMRIEGLVADADDKCGNGAAWRVELSSKSGIAELAGGTFGNGGKQPFRPDHTFKIKAGDVISVVVSPRDGNHACDATHVELKLSELGGRNRIWNLASDVVDRVLESNPLPDSYGHPATWHFCARKIPTTSESPIPPGSALALWRAAVLDSKPIGHIEKLAGAVQDVLTAEEVEALQPPDAQLRATLLDWNGPLDWITLAEATGGGMDSTYGIDPTLFGKGDSVAPTDLLVPTPQVLELRLPAKLATGAEFVTTAVLHGDAGREGSAAQFQVHSTKPERVHISPAVPILVCEEGQERQRVETALQEFRDVFPPALCYARIVPVDEVVTLTLFHREDEHLQRLMLNPDEIARLDRLWDELRFVSQEPLKLVVAFEQISEFATQDRPDLVKAFAPLSKPINDRADAFRRQQLEAEPTHVAAVLEFADRAWRRPLTASERQELRDLYRQLRESEIPHAEAIRLMIARVLTAPVFLFKIEEPAAGTAAAPVSDLELATRLSYLLWSSLPDPELRAAAEAGRLNTEEILLSHTRRMLKGGRTRRLAVEFACQWLHVRNFDENAEKNENLYPEFVSLRDDMYEETVRFFENMFRNNGSILDLLAGDHTFLNETLARHYGIDGVTGGDWRRIEDVRDRGRGGILGMATFLASQSGASRTSPILRGTWVSETLLGERLPRPPANVPQLPDEIPSGLTERQLIERHSSVPECAICHVKIDPYGFALEQFDAIGRLRSQTVDTKTKLVDGKTIEGLDGLRDYLMNDRRADIVRQFCRKLLGYALGREVQLSDEPLLNEMQERLEANEYRFHVAVEAIVTSRQFREIRGMQAAVEQASTGSATD